MPRELLVLVFILFHFVYFFLCFILLLFMIYCCFLICLFDCLIVCLFVFGYHPGDIPLRELVYRVHALPPSMLPLVWDFGQLSSSVELKYIRQIVWRCVRMSIFLSIGCDVNFTIFTAPNCCIYCNEQSSICIPFVSIIYA